jgi:prephenate dehydratase
MTLPRPVCVAIQGAHGAYSEEALHRLLVCPFKIETTRSFPEMFSAVAKHEAHACLAPMENSLVGSIFQNYDLLLRYGYRVRGEVYLRVKHCLIAPVGTYFDDIERVYSHPLAIDQCQEFFRRHPRIEAIATYDTAGSVKMLITERMTGAAAIAGAGAATHYGGKVIRTDIEDDAANYTRFFLLSLGDAQLGGLVEQFSREAVGPPKTSIVFHIDNAPGSLCSTLEPFAQRRIDLTRIESRPVRGKPFDYLFYLDFLGTTATSDARDALAELKAKSGFTRVLGTYPSGRLDWVGAVDHPGFLDPS